MTTSRLSKALWVYESRSGARENLRQQLLRLLQFQQNEKNTKPFYYTACNSSEISLRKGRPYGQVGLSERKRPGWDLNPRGPEDQQLAWSDSLRSRGSTPSAPMRSGSVAVPGSATRATTTGCLPRINVVLCNSPAGLPVEASETLSMILCAIHSNHMRGCIGSCEIS